jgi:tetratricopeptide (TPR) repeat protein
MEKLPLDLAELRSLFLQVLDLPEQDRAQLLGTLSPEVREELQALLDYDQGSETRLRGIVDAGRLPVTGLNERFGPFITTELLGRGGMGAVYKAERADGELAQIVAIKVIERGWLNPRALDRFRRERQILAGLAHPNIARLIDGGTRPDGVPYLVMEFVEGLPLDRYCEQKKLKTPERLALFLPLCDAIDAAHQQLIVHRDLKPSNVLVDAAGDPKLLDFGIAEAIGQAGGATTQTIMLTPDYASPEQARGEPATTAADIYGLGAVLYFLLTGRAPHTAGNLSAGELQRLIAETPPPRPGSLNPELRGDLENILLKALHQDPARRYRTARDMGDDVRRYLEHRPVLATPDTVSYRVARFVRRHRVACAAGALAVIAAIAGTAVSLYEAHRAQQHFAQVRDLANRFIFDFESAIRDTPGTLEARRMVASTARQYLSQLAQDARRDPGLQRELAESYSRLARVEMSAGEHDAYIEHLKKSIELRKNLRDDCCGQPSAHLQFLVALTDLARTNDDSRSTELARQEASEAVANARAWYARSPTEPFAVRAMVTTLSTEGNILLNRGQPRDARVDLEQATRLSEQLMQQNPADDEMAFDRARAGHWLASALTTLGDAAAARVEEDRAKVVMDGLLARHPDNFRWRNLRVRMAVSTSVILRTLSQSDPSLKALILPANQEAHEMARENVRRNPGDRDLLDTDYVMTSRLGNQMAREDRPAESMALLEEAKGIVEELLKGEPANARYLYLLAVNRTGVGRQLMNAKRWSDAVPVLAEAERRIGQVLERRPTDLAALSVKATILMNQTIDQRNLGHLEIAREKCKLSLAAAGDLIAKNKDAKVPFEDIDELRREAHTLGVPDTTVMPH